MSSRIELEKQLKDHDKLDKWWATLEALDKEHLKVIYEYEKAGGTVTATLGLYEATNKATEAIPFAIEDNQAEMISRANKQDMKMAGPQPPDPYPMEGSPSGRWPVKDIHDAKTTT